MKKRRSFLKKRDQGVALIVVIIALALATMLGLVVATTTTTEVQIAGAAAASTKGYFYAELGLNAAIAMVKNSKGDFNDLLSGPDGIANGRGAFINGLETHGNEF